MAVTKEQLSAAESLVAGRSALTLLAAMGPQQPDGLIRAFVLAARQREVGLTLLFADLAGTFAFLDDLAAKDIAAGRLRLVSLAGAIARHWSRDTDYLPYSLWDIDRMLRQGLLAVDVVVAGVGVGNGNDRFTFGDMVGYTAAALETSTAAVFEVGEPMRTPVPGPEIPGGRAAIVLKAGSGRDQGFASAERTSGQRAIGRFVASLVPDEATIQIGLGSIADAIVENLRARRDLGIHSGIISPALGRLVAAGVVNGRAKSEDRGVAVSTGLWGDGDHAEDGWRRAIELRPVSETHDPRILSRHSRLWAINSALEVDLRGQVNAEFAGGLRVASGGGQSDFARAAHLSEGGASVIALPSRTTRGDSRIVARLPEQHPPTTASQDVDFIVTEYGVARLRGLTMRERGEAIIAIAEPSARDTLRRQLHTLAEDTPAALPASAQGGGPTLPIHP